MEKPIKEKEPKAAPSTLQEPSATTSTPAPAVTPDWSGFQAYSPIPPPGPGFLASSPHGQPYMWGVQHIMPPYGAAPHPHVAIKGGRRPRLDKPIAGLDNQRDLFLLDHGGNSEDKRPLEAKAFQVHRDKDDFLLSLRPGTPLQTQELPHSLDRRVLARYTALAILKLHVSFGYAPSMKGSVDGYVGFAVARGVKDVELNLSPKVVFREPRDHYFVPGIFALISVHREAAFRVLLAQGSSGQRCRLEITKSFVHR
ncbi:hypothetical protein MLD38_010598 [Melastoma candidum]|uniref:Uncharacterized protein n=1 Tax=Melastoma candidum TaxID=119954 RepID=A0ACB9QZZ0_9MYRT|nr:hypothetical protein MLD38_010598 [Melastoma candidum]